jgi:glutathione S-transferase
MLLLQFSTSHYCRKARLALGYKGISYQTENLTPGLHILKLKPITGLTTVPVLLPQVNEQPQAVADSSAIFQFLEVYQPLPSFMPEYEREKSQALMLEDWLDESIGTATRFVYYHFRAGEGKYIDNSLLSQTVINIVIKQYGINNATVALAQKRLNHALAFLSTQWVNKYLIVDSLTIADITAAALLSPLALIPSYREEYPWLFNKIIDIHQLCHEPLPPGL